MYKLGSVSNKADTISTNDRFNRLGQKLSIPVLLSERLSPTILAFSTIIPTITYIGAYRYVILPRKKRRLKERIQELREENKEFIVQKKAEALDAISLMERDVEKKIKGERDRNGEFRVWCD